jgi:hypothetical protein
LSPGRRSAIGRVNLFSGEITSIGKCIHHYWSGRGAPDAGIKHLLSDVVITLAQGSVANSALRQLFDNQIIELLSIAELVNGRHFDAEKR